MQNSKQFLKDKQILPRISFKDGKPHAFKLVKDKVDSLKNDKGEVVEGVKYLVEEAGEPKTFFTSSIALITKLSEISEDTEVIVQMKSRKADNGQWQSYYEVQSKSKVGKDMGEEIPVIEEDESVPPIPETEESSTDFEMESSKQF